MLSNNVAELLHHIGPKNPEIFDCKTIKLVMRTVHVMHRSLLIWEGINTCTGLKLSHPVHVLLIIFFWGWGGVLICYIFLSVNLLVSKFSTFGVFTWFFLSFMQMVLSAEHENYTYYINFWINAYSHIFCRNQDAAIIFRCYKCII